MTIKCNRKLRKVEILVRLKQYSCFIFCQLVRYINFSHSKFKVKLTAYHYIYIYILYIYYIYYIYILHILYIYIIYILCIIYIYIYLPLWLLILLGIDGTKGTNHILHSAFAFFWCNFLTNNLPWIYNSRISPS